MTDDDLDILLATPLADVADGMFSARVTARVRQVQKLRDGLVVLGPVLALFALVPFLPLEEFTHAILSVTPVVANSAAISLALGVLILTFTFDQRLRE
jgi:uncharacterized membrane protein (DUF485 family)